MAEPVTATNRICFISFDKANPTIIKRGISTNKDKKFIVILFINIFQPFFTSI